MRKDGGKEEHSRWMEKCVQTLSWISKELGAFRSWHKASIAGTQYVSGREVGCTHRAVNFENFAPE